MFFKKWKDIPNEIKNEYTYTYYKKLEKKKFSLILKRFFDILASMILLIILSPILLILAICIKLDSKGPVFYRQERITMHNKMFKIFKFRTMIENADKTGSLVTLQNDSRITRIGKIIRKIRLDEIPQLFNVLKGDMSFVGTRPEVKKYVDKYNDEMKATLLMPAGITSIASIKFKDEDKILKKCLNKKKQLVMVGKSNQLENEYNNIDDAYIEEVLPKKMKYNLEYIENFSVLNDITICLNTVQGVLKH